MACCNWPIAVFSSVALRCTSFALDTRWAPLACAFNASFCFWFKSDAPLIAVIAACFALFKFCVPFNACFALLTLLSACSTAVFAVFGPVCLFKMVSAADIAWL